MVRQMGSSPKHEDRQQGARQEVPAPGACWASDRQASPLHLATTCGVPAGQRAGPSRPDAQRHSDAHQPLADVAGQQQHGSQGGGQQQLQSEKADQQQPASEADAKPDDQPAEDEVLFQMDEVRTLGIHCAPCLAAFAIVVKPIHLTDCPCLWIYLAARSAAKLEGSCRMVLLRRTHACVADAPT